MLCYPLKNRPSSCLLQPVAEVMSGIYRTESIMFTRLIKLFVLPAFLCLQVLFSDILFYMLATMIQDYQNSTCDLQTSLGTRTVLFQQKSSAQLVAQLPYGTYFMALGRNMLIENPVTWLLFKPIRFCPTDLLFAVIGFLLKRRC